MLRLLCLLLPVLTVGALAIQPSPHLNTEADRQAFRNWFAFLAEAQYFTPQNARAPEITDCSSLVRYAYREALKNHNAQWATQANLILIPALPSVEQYNYPHTPTGPKLFAITPSGHYTEFANAVTLVRFNAFPIARTLAAARRGDILFFHQVAAKPSYHVMITLEESQITHDRTRYVVYNTGPDGSNEGEMKRLTYDELLQFPDNRWRPIPENKAFDGVFRWNILKE